MTVAIVKVIARGPQGPAGTGSAQTLAQVLANGHDANAVEITNAGAPTADSSLDTRGARNTAIAALSATYQPLDSDLTAIAALTTTTFGRAVLALADAAALRTAAGLGTAATHPSTDFDAAGAAAAAQAASQPLDSDLTAIAALTTTSFGRAFLALADAAAGRTALGLGTLATQSGTFSGTSSGTNTGDQTTVSGNAGTATALQTGRAIDGQTFDGTAPITVIAPGTHAATGKTTPVDADEMPLVDSAASNVLKKLTWANLKATLKTYFDTLYQALDSELTALAGLTSAADKLPYFTGSGTAAVTTLSSFIRTLLDDTDAATALSTLGASVWVPTLAIGDYIALPGQPSLAAQGTGGSGKVWFQRFLVPRTYTFDRISIRVASNAGTTGTARLGVYSDSDGRPGTLLFDAGTVSTLSTTGAKEITISQQISPGVYWAAFQNEFTGAAPTFTGTGTGQGGNVFMPSNTDNTFTAAYSGSNTGALPSTPPSLSASTIAFVVWLRRSA